MANYLIKALAVAYLSYMLRLIKLMNEAFPVEKRQK